MTTATTQNLECSMADCRAEVTHIDNKGFVYCASHGIARRFYRPCRKLRPHEVRRLERDEPIRY